MLEPHGFPLASAEDVRFAPARPSSLPIRGSLAVSLKASKESNLDSISLPAEALRGLEAGTAIIFSAIGQSILNRLWHKVSGTTNEEMVPGDGFEPPTLRFSVACSTN